MAAREENAETNPSYFLVVEPMLREGKGGVSKLLCAYPNFDPDATPMDVFSESYLHVACGRGQLNVVQGLMACGANLLCKNRFSWTVLQRSCWEPRRGDAQLMTWLLSEYADVRATVNAVNRDGNTALHYAVAAADAIAKVRVLLAHGAELSLTTENSARYTPARIAQLDGPPVVAEMLEIARRSFAVLAIGEWRPWRQARFPPQYRAAMRTLVILAHARPSGQQGVRTCSNGTKEIVSRYPETCLDLLPEELLQYLFAYITSAGVPDVWTHDI